MEKLAEEVRPETLSKPPPQRATGSIPRATRGIAIESMTSEVVMVTPMRGRKVLRRDREVVLRSDARRPLRVMSGELLIPEGSSEPVASGLR